MSLSLAEQIKPEHSLITLPCRDSYVNGAGDRVTSALGTLSDDLTVLVGDGTTPATFPTLVSPHGFDYNGTTNYLTIPDSDGLSFGDSTTDSPFSLSAMVYLNDNVGVATIMSKYHSTNNSEWTLYGNGSELEFVMRDVSQTAFRFRVTNANTLLSGRRRFVTATYDGTTINIYVDGVIASMAAQPASGYIAMEPGDNDVCVGRQNNASDFFDGIIDTPQIWPFELTPLQASMLAADARARWNV